MTTKVTGGAASGREPAGYVVHDNSYYAACIVCGERHGDDIPCRETEWKKYWQRLGEQAKTLLAGHSRVLDAVYS